MPAPTWEDLDDFLDPEEFGFQAVITLQDGGTVPLCVLFDESGEQAELRDAYTHDTSAPRVTCREDLVRDVARGDAMAISFPAGAETFEVLAAPQPDGTGFAVIHLARP